MDLLIYLLGPLLLVTLPYSILSKVFKIIPNLAALERLEHSGHCFARIYTLHSISQIWKGKKIAFRGMLWLMLWFLFSASGCSVRFSRGHRGGGGVGNLHGQEAQGDGDQVSESITRIPWWPSHTFKIHHPGEGLLPGRHLAWEPLPRLCVWRAQPPLQVSHCHVNHRQSVNQHRIAVTPSS